MIRRAIRSLRSRQPRRWWPTPSILLAGSALFIVLGGSAVAATGLIKAGNIAPGAVTSAAIRNGAVEPKDLGAGTRALLGGGQGAPGPKGDPGSTGSAGGRGETGPSGSPGTSGANGANGPNGANGAEGVQGSKGATGSQGVQGPIGLEGPQGTPGSNGTNGTDGTIAPLSATQGLTVLPTTPSTSPPATVVVSLVVPAGNYVVMAKTQLFQTGAGDSVECLLKSGGTIIDQAAMRTLPALSSVPASMQAVTTVTTSPTTLSVQCKVSVADGTANYSSLIAIPTA